MDPEDTGGRTVQAARDIAPGKALVEAVLGGHKRTALAGGGSSTTGVDAKGKPEAGEVHNLRHQGRRHTRMETGSLQFSVL